MALDLAMVMGSLLLILAVLLPLLHRLDQQMVLRRLDQDKLNQPWPGWNGMHRTG